MPRRLRDSLDGFCPEPFFMTAQSTPGRPERQQKSVLPCRERLRMQVLDLEMNHFSFVLLVI